MAKFHLFHIYKADLVFKNQLETLTTKEKISSYQYIQKKHLTKANTNS